MKLCKCGSKRDSLTQRYCKSCRVAYWSKYSLVRRKKIFSCSGVIAEGMPVWLCPRIDAISTQSVNQ